MIRIALLLCAFGLLTTVDAAQDRWEKDWVALEAKDKADPPKPGTIIFVGSSSFVGWGTLAKDLAPLPVYNRAFGGSSTPDQVRALPRILLPNKPAVVVYYCGDNDLANPKADPQKAVKGFQDFVAALHQELPGTRVIYVSIKPSPSRFAAWPVVSTANAAIKEWCTSNKLLTYVDVSTPMLDAEGKPQEKLFSKDMLHMNADGYKLWTGIIKPVVEQTWAQVQGGK